jgi:hypothetical protein
MSSSGEAANYGAHTTVGGGAYTRDRPRNCWGNATISRPSLVTRFMLFDGSPPNRHSVEVLILSGHKAPFCPSYASCTPTPPIAPSSSGTR